MAHGSPEQLVESPGDDEGDDLPVASLQLPAGTAPLDEPHQPREIGGKYRTVDVIGEGGMGIVYEAVHLVTGRRVAIKKLRGDPTGDGQGRARFMREARAASAIGHPGIVEVLDAGWDHDDPFLVLELLEGDSLDERIADPGLTLGEVQRIGVELLDALAAAQRESIVHRDIKPENIFLHHTPEGPHVKILDFGIAKRTGPTETRLTVTGTVMGTPAYMSPEQARGDAVDGRADVWSVAAILFEAVTGSPPFDGENYNILIARLLMEAPPDIRALRPDLPEPVLAAIEGGLQPEPEMRFGSAAVMRDVLRDRLSVGELREGAVTAPWAGTIARSQPRIRLESGERPALRGRDTPTMAAPTEQPAAPALDAQALPRTTPVLVAPAARASRRFWVALAMGLALAGALALVRFGLASDETPATEPAHPSLETTGAETPVQAGTEDAIDEGTADATDELPAPSEEDVTAPPETMPAADIEPSRDRSTSARRRARHATEPEATREPAPPRRRFDALREYE